MRSKGVRSGHKHQLAHVLKKWCIVETYLIFYTLPHETYHVCSKIWNIYEKMLRRRGDLRSGAQALAHTGLHFVLGCQNRWDDFLSWDDFLFIRNSEFNSGIPHKKKVVRREKVVRRKINMAACWESAVAPRCVFHHLYSILLLAGAIFFCTDML